MLRHSRRDDLFIGRVGPVPISLSRFTIGSSGPHLAIVAGIHGNEPHGLWILKALFDDLLQFELKGRLTVIPCANPLGLGLAMRRVPGSDQDLNRRFPGRLDGTMAEQLAFHIFEILKGADFVVDLHSFRMRNPVMGVYFHVGGEALREAAKGALAAIDPEVVWSVAFEETHAADRIYRHALGPMLAEAGVPNTVIEVSFADSLASMQIPRVVDGLRRLMGHLGLIDYPATLGTPPYYRLEPHFSPDAGLFQPQVPLMMPLRKGEVIGEITRVPDFDCVPVIANESGQLIQMVAASMVDCGSPLYVMGHAFAG